MNGVQGVPSLYWPVLRGTEDISLTLAIFIIIMVEVKKEQNLQSRGALTRTRVNIKRKELVKGLSVGARQSSRPSGRRCAALLQLNVNEPRRHGGAQNSQDRQEVLSYLIPYAHFLLPLTASGGNHTPVDRFQGESTLLRSTAEVT